MEHQIRPYRPGDEAGIVASFNRVFREVCGPGYVDRPLETWHWEYRDHPVGTRISLAVAPDGTVLAQYAGLPQRFDTARGEAVFVHIVDSFVVPEARAGLKRPGLFVTTAKPWFQQCRDAGDAVLYGYPVRQAMRIGQRYLDYNPVRCLDYLVRDVPGAAGGPAGDVTVRVVTAIPADHDALWNAVRAEQTCLLRRDQRYLHWRYVANPARDAYTLLEARRDGVLAGLAVLRPFHELVPNACTIADWVVPTGDAGARAGLIAAAAEIAGSRGRGKLLAVFAPYVAEFEALRDELGFRVESAAVYEERILSFLTYRPELSLEFLGERWWYTLGDSDLV